jgi:hypothetical protein
MEKRTRRGAAALSAGALALGGLLLAACSSPGTPSGTPTPPTHATTTTAGGGTATTTTPTTAPPTTGQLESGPSISVPIAANLQITAAEAPDGAVFMAPTSNDPSVQTVVWVVDQNGPAAIAEHVSGGVSALAADAANLYVVTGSTVLAFTRSTGNPAGQWSLPAISTANTSDADFVSMTTGAGAVLVMVARGNLEDVYHLTPGSSAAPKLIAQGTSAAFGPDGSVYYERTDNHLAVRRAGGATTVGPTLADTPNGEGGGVADVDAVAGGILWVSDPAGQGVDTTLSSYSADTLQQMGTFPGSVVEEIVDTDAGPLVLSGADGPGDCPQDTATAASCVFRLAANAALSEPLVVGPANQLLGPDPAVVAADTNSNGLLVERLT